MNVFNTIFTNTKYFNHPNFIHYNIYNVHT